ncbi:unnamed protein product [Callosobruchus maculatus]|uniref:Uncharacterized protein n=1 Tax=Callosobruchus maculatus TaxID=64391 RepID=A0A653D865_CALMS|nr:unnamed protein product [Callosobruchus maculatus]
MCQMQTPDEVLKEKMLGAFTSLKTQVKKGQMLEPSVLEKLSHQSSIHIHTAGFFMN